MGYIDRLLAQNERIVFVTRPHWVSLLPAILIDLGVAIVIIALSVGGALIAPPYSPSAASPTPSGSRPR
ncbi:MAG: hypothetical protein ACK4WK_03825 [Anaerolineae bacterium]